MVTADDMTIEIDQLKEFLPVFVPSIVEATLTTCTAAALLRPVTDAEVDRVADKIAQAVTDYVSKTVDELNESGAGISDELASDYAEKLFYTIFETAWTLTQQAMEEIRQRTGIL